MLLTLKVKLNPTKEQRQKLLNTMETFNAACDDISKNAYESGMARAFSRCSDALEEAGRLVVVFANKQPDAWETLVSALIRSGFVVDGSWPIQTEQPKQASFGEIAVPAAFQLARQLKKAPKAIAAELSK